MREQHIFISKNSKTEAKVLRKGRLGNLDDTRRVDEGNEKENNREEEDNNGVFSFLTLFPTVDLI